MQRGNDNKATSCLLTPSSISCLKSVEGLIEGLTKVYKTNKYMTTSTNIIFNGLLLGHVGFNFGIVCYAKLASSQLLSAH